MALDGERDAGADAVLGHAEVREPGDGGEVVELASLSGFAFDDRGSAGETRSLCFAYLSSRVVPVLAQSSTTTNRAGH